MTTTTPLPQLNLSVLAGRAGDMIVALRLSEVDTTIAYSAPFQLPGLEAYFSGVVMFGQRTITVLNRTALLGDHSTQASFLGTDFRRIVVLRTGFGIVFDDLSYVKEVCFESGSADNPETAPIIMGKIYEPVENQPSEAALMQPEWLTLGAEGATGAPFSCQVFTIEIAGHSMLLPLPSLHHVTVVSGQDLQFSETLNAWVHVDAAEIPIIDAAVALKLSPASSIMQPLRGEGYVMYANLSDGTNFGIILSRDSTQTELGAPQDVTAYPLDGLVAANSAYDCLCVVKAEGAEKSYALLINADRLYQGYYAALEDASSCHTADVA